MRKFIHLISARQGLPGSAFRDWVRHHHLPEVAARAAHLTGLVANFVDIPASRANSAVDPPPYDVILESWTDVDVDPAILLGGAGEPGAWLRADLAARAGRIHGYEVQESVEIAEPAPVSGGVVPGIRNVTLIAFLTGQAPARSRELWDLHVPLAKQGLPGLIGYARNLDPQPITPDTPPCQGIGSLNFGTLFESEHYPFLPDIVDFLDLPAIIGMDCTQVVVKTKT